MSPDAPKTLTFLAAMLLMLALPLRLPVLDEADSPSSLPLGFLDEVIIDDLTQANGMAFAEDGRIFVFEQRGLV